MLGSGPFTTIKALTEWLGYRTMRSTMSQPGGVFEPDPCSEPGPAAVGPWFGYLVLVVVVISIAVVLLRENGRRK